MSSKERMCSTGQSYSIHSCPVLPQPFLGHLGISGKLLDYPGIVLCHGFQNQHYGLVLCMGNLGLGIGVF